MHRLKKILIWLAKKHPFPRYLMSKYIYFRSEILQKIYGRHGLSDKLVVFEAYMSNSYACSPRALYEYMLNDPRYAEYRFVWSFTDIERHNFVANERTTLVQFKSREYYRAYTQAKYWVVNGWIPSLLHKRPDQVMLQCWHGTPLKRLRNDLIKNTQHATLTYEQQVEENKTDTARYDYFISPSRFASEKFTSAFALKELGKENIIIETGYPRNDFLYTYTSSDVEKIKARQGLPKDKQVLLYAPTWRDNQYEEGKGFVHELALNFDMLRQKLSDRYVILFRTHYTIASKMDLSEYEGFVYDVSEIDDINELYVISDALITDYSSVFFDYANLRRPILFYMYDLDLYENELRGFYLDIKELPGKIIETETELIAALENLKDYPEQFSAVYSRFSKKFNYLDDGKASQRVAERVFTDV